MDTLKKQFRMNGLPYTLLMRNDKVALYGIGGEDDPKDEIKIRHYEVDIIYHRKDKYGEREAISKNEDFGRDRSRCYIEKETAEAYFYELTAELMAEQKSLQGVAKSIAGVEENHEMIVEYQIG